MTATSKAKGNLIAEALRYGTHCQGIILFHVHTHAFIHELNAFAVPTEAVPHLPTPAGMVG